LLMKTQSSMVPTALLIGSDLTKVPLQNSFNSKYRQAATRTCPGGSGGLPCTQIRGREEDAGHVLLSFCLCSFSLAFLSSCRVLMDLMHLMTKATPYSLQATRGAKLAHRWISSFSGWALRLQPCSRPNTLPHKFAYKICVHR
jgi:hypothetical protein